MADKETEEKPVVVKKPTITVAQRYADASWNAFGAVFLAGFGIAVTAMSSASFSSESQLATIMTLVGGLAIFGLSAMFAKMTITEFGRAFAATLTAANAERPAADADDEEQSPKSAAGGRR